MGTRCQVLIVSKNNPNDRIMMYHHWDGYPSHMLESIYGAWKYSVTPRVAYEGGKPVDESWMSYRVGKVASFLCHQEPGQYEPEASFEFHWDIEWFYRIDVSGENGWEVEIFHRRPAFVDNPCMGNLFLTHEKAPISEFITKKGTVKHSKLKEIGKKLRILMGREIPTGLDLIRGSNRILKAAK